ncbi:19026_t:CDS:2, partial [Rhizophagus irregularis]
LIRELFSNTTRLSEIKERKGLRRESIREAEEWNENTRHELIMAYYNFGEATCPPQKNECGT